MSLPTVRGGPWDAAGRATRIGTLGYLTACVLFALDLPLSAAPPRHFDPLCFPPLRYRAAPALLGSMLAVALGPRQLRSPNPRWRLVERNSSCAVANRMIAAAACGSRL